MSDIKRGDILAVKTTGEIVYLLGNPYGSDTGQKVDVRRPLLTEYGIKHEITTFFADELEPVEQYAEREANIQVLKLKMQRKLMDEKVKAMLHSVKKKSRNIFEVLARGIANFYSEFFKNQHIWLENAVAGN